MVLDLDAVTAPAEFHYMPETTSTMEVAATLARQGAGHLDTVFAEVQTLGRGRRGRVWQHFPECNIAMTVVIRQGLGPQLALVCSLAVYKALQQFVPTGLSIKWPNDLLLNGRKVAGLLVEQGPDWALLGLGINVKTPPAVPEDFPGTALETGAEGLLSREAVTGAVLAELAPVLQAYAEKGWQPMAPAYTAICSTLGQHVRWQQEQQEISGTAIGLTKDGTLELKTADGRVHTVMAGDIIAEGKSHFA